MTIFKVSCQICLVVVDINNKFGTFNVYTGNAYRNLQDLENALNYYNQALSMAGSEKHQLLRIYGNIGLTYKVLGEYNTALGYFRVALEYSVEIGDKRNECIGLEHLGNCH